MDLNIYFDHFFTVRELLTFFGITFIGSLISICRLSIESVNPFFLNLSSPNSKDELKYQFLIEHKNRLLINHVLLNYLLWVCIGLFTSIYLFLPGTSTFFLFNKIVIGALVFLSFVLSDLIPREFVKKRPAFIIKFFFPFICLIDKLMFLPALIFTPITHFISRKIKEEPASIFNRTENEIKKLIESAEHTGEIKNDEKQLFKSVFDFRNTIVRQIMTPRVDLHSVSVETSIEEFLNLVAETGKSRVPIYEDTDDQIIGIIHVKDVLIAQSKKNNFNLKTIARSAYFVHENKGIQELLKEFRVNRNQMAIVQDEFGGTAGVVTVEDIVEELVGEIVDEYDKEEFLMEKDNTGYLVYGKASCHHLSHSLPYPIENNDFDTIGGYVFGLFGKKSKQGDKISDANYEFEVRETDGRRILKLYIRPLIKPNYEQ